jgi:hypothetical protein
MVTLQVIWILSGKDFAMVLLCCIGLRNDIQLHAKSFIHFNLMCCMGHY